MIILELLTATLIGILTAPIQITGILSILMIVLSVSLIINYGRS